MSINLYPDDNILQEALVTRFLRYTSISSQSDASSTIVPSTPGQRELAELLKEELTSMGLHNLHLSEYGVLTGYLPKNCKSSIPSMGFCAHLDTVDVGLRPSIRPQRVTFTGAPICLNKEEQIYLDPAEHPELLPYKGQEILVTDGLSVLGADNKAAISTIMTALQVLRDTPSLLHGDIYVAFVPDEEIGLVGAKHMDFNRFPVQFAYTIDSCEIGEVVYQTFNAGQGTLTIEGVSAHPMSAKGVLLNPTLIAVDFANYFNRLETPENTDGTDGYIWVQAINSNQRTATVSLNIRDHHKDRYEAKKAYIREAVNFLQKRYPRAKLTLTIDDVYGNIEDAITSDNHYAIDYVYQAMDRLGITPKTIAMRGGTDGSYISTQGIPTPNFFTGAHNFHSRNEFLPLPSFVASCKMALTLITLTAEQGNA